MKKKVNKFNNKKVTVEGIKFDSQMESKYYLHLKDMQERGLIDSFVLQPVFELQPKFVKRGINFRAITYKADFHVFANGMDYVVDVKGQETADFKIKAKMFEKLYPQELILVSWSGVDGGWIELKDLKVARKLRKTEREKGIIQ